METLFNFQWISDNPIQILSFLFNITWKCSFIIGAVYLITRILRRGSSATRHLIWSIALIGLLLLPIFSLTLPSWEIPILPSGLSVGREISFQPTTTDPTQSKKELSIASLQNTENDQESARNSNQTSAINDEGQSILPPNDQSVKKPLSLLRNATPLKLGATILLLVWIMGTGVIFLRQLIGRVVIEWVAHKANKISDPNWLKLLDNLKKHQGITRTIRLLQSDKVNLPITWGLIRPKIMLPLEADEWSEEHKQFVFVHELAHVKRWDTMTQLLAQLSGAFHWFNPFVWIAQRQFLNEREHACDDYVLKQGSRASEYAGLLLDIAQSLPTGKFTSLATVAMARRTQLEGRLLAILDPNLRRRTLTRLAAVLSTIGILTMVLPLSAMKPMARERATSESPLLKQGSEMISSNDVNQVTIKDTEESLIVKEEISTDADGKKEEIPAELKRNLISIKSPVAIKKDPSPKENESQSVQDKKSNQDNNAIIIQSLSEALKDPILEVRLEAAETLGRFKSPAAVKALIPALKDENKQMRMTVAEALGDIGDKKSVEPLISLLKDVDWEVRSYAAEALGDLEDSRAVNPLGNCLQDDNRNVRKNVVYALGEIDHRSAVRHLTTALKDADWEIRMEAASALGEIEDPSTIPALSEALTDENLNVRKASVEALGEIGDRRAVKFLTKVLQDKTSWEVRKEAAHALGEIADPSAVSSLSIAINDENSEVRKTVVWALGELDDSQAVKPLIQALSDSDWKIRKEAAHALGEIEDGSAVDALSACLKDGHREVRDAAVDALSEIDDPRAVKPLMELLTDPDWEIRKNTAHALGEIEDPVSVPALCNILNDENLEVRKTVIRALGEIQDRGAVNALMDVINDPDWEIREQVVRALGEIGDPRAVDILSAKLKDDNESVRRAAAKALGEIQWKNE